MEDNDDDLEYLRETCRETCKQIMKTTRKTKQTKVHVHTNSHYYTKCA
jgi:hypothetical protein